MATKAGRPNEQMYSSYLKESLAKLATLRTDADQIGSEQNRKVITEMFAGTFASSPYPGMFGQLIGRCWQAHYDVETAQRNAGRLEVIEREYERLIAIFEALSVDLDEEAPPALGALP